jgi:hypothetical protein
MFCCSKTNRKVPEKSKDTHYRDFYIIDEPSQVKINDLKGQNSSKKKTNKSLEQKLGLITTGTILKDQIKSRPFIIKPVDRSPTHILVLGENSKSIHKYKTDFYKQLSVANDFEQQADKNVLKTDQKIDSGGFKILNDTGFEKMKENDSSGFKLLDTDKINDSVKLTKEGVKSV